MVYFVFFISTGFMFSMLINHVKIGWNAIEDLTL